MGYHTGGSGVMLHGAIWGTPELRRHVWDYCPEVKMTLMMDVAKYVPGECGARWKNKKKRTFEGGGGGGGLDSPDSPDSPDEGAGDVDVAAAGDWSAVVDVGYGSEVIDGVEYPLLPPGLTPFI